MKRFLFSSIYLLIASAQFAGAVYFRHFLPEDGLTHPAVLSICQDSTGRLWFGTENGISIYDGASFSSLKPGVSDAFGSKFGGMLIYTLICDSKGDVFFRTDEEVVRYEAKTGKVQVIYKKAASALFIEDGVVYAVDDNRLMEWKPVKKSLDYIRTLPFRKITHCLKDRSGRSWYVAKEGVFYSTPGSDYTKLCPNYQIYSILEASDSSVWLSSRQNGLLRISKEGGTESFSVQNSSHKGLKSNDIRQIAEDKEGNLWLGTFNGLYCYNKQDGFFTSYIREEKKGSLSHSSVYSVFVDNSGTLWLGTYYGGINYADIRRNPFVFYPADDNRAGLSHPVVGNMAEDRQGNIWICTEGGGLNMLRPEKGEIEHFTSSVFPYSSPHTNLKWIDYDQEKELLYIGATSKGLYSYDLRKKRFNHFTSENEALAFINIIARYKDKLFLSAKEGVFVYFPKSGKDSLIFKTDNLNFYPIASGEDQRLWVGGDSVYVFGMSGLEKLGAYKLLNGTESARPLRIFIAKDGSVFVSTYGQGIFKFDKEKNEFKLFISKSSSLLNQYCYQIAETASSDLIVSGEKGFNIINKKGEILKTYLLGRNIPLNSIVRDCGLLVSKDGVIYAGGTNGLMAFSEEDLILDADKHEIYLSELYVNGKPVSPNDGSGILSERLPYTHSLKISHNKDRIGIRFAAKKNPAGFNMADYEYRLKNYDDRWYQMEGDMIVYTNLSPGKYVLELRERYGEENPVSCSLGIKILVPWYFSWQAVFLYMAIAAFFLFLFRRNAKAKAETAAAIKEKERMVEINEAKLRFFTSVSHEFKTPLTIISGQLEMILQGYKLAPAIYNRLLKMLNQTKSLGRLISDLIEFRKYEQDKVVLRVRLKNLNDLATAVHDRLSDVAKKEGINFILQLASDEAEAFIDQEQMDRVLTNLVSNALKFTQRGGSVTLAVKADKERVKINVTDTGKGFSEEETEKIFERFYRSGDKSAQGSGIGLALVKETVEMHHGSIKAHSKEGVGADFSISLNKGTEHFIGDDKVIIENVEDKPALAENNTEKIEKHFIPIDDIKAGETSEELHETLLLAEDNAELLEILEELFSPFYSILKTKDGKEALELIKTFRPALVVSDILMPSMSGTELCSAVKNDIELCHIPIVLLTALDLPEQELGGLLQGADDYISKPFDARLLLARCNNIIRNRKKLSEKFGREGKGDISILATNKLDKEFLDKLSEIIETEIADMNLNNDVIAEKMNMSRASFYNKFKNLVGETPNEYINNRRLAKAQSLLLSDMGISIAEVAEALGFNSANYFSRKFKEKFGLTPVRYRQEKNITEA